MSPTRLFSAAATAAVAVVVLAVPLAAAAAPAHPAAAPVTQAADGRNVYKQFTSNTLPNGKLFFPIGVWEEQYLNAAHLTSFGWNMIVNPVGTYATVPPGFYTVGALEDEADMWAGPGSATWTGNYPGEGPICSPSSAQCGFTVMQAHQSEVSPGELRYTNYGKGVAFWDSDAGAAQFVNDYQDVTSMDLYWGTDNDLCQGSQGGVMLNGTYTNLTPAQCHKPSNYGRTVDRMRSLVNPARSTPIWNYVELGTPGSNSTAMPVSEIKPAVWSSLIHGARGIVYFNHSFGGSCQSQHVIDDCNPAVAPIVTALDAQIKALALQLNAPTVTGSTRTGSIDALTKWDGTHYYVFTDSTTTGAATSGSVQLPCAGNGTATVIGEGRTVPVVAGRISDTWADQNAVHLYQVAGGGGCNG